MDKSASFDTRYCALIYLMSRQAMTPQSHLPAMIADHLNRIAGHQDIERHPLLRDACRRLAPFWDGTHRHADPERRFERYNAGGYGL